MSKLNLEPQTVFGFFEQMSEIPRGSGNTQAISDWCVAFAKQRNLAYVQDKLGNIIIFKDGTPGYEKAEPMILQGHLDMVCEAVPGSTKDMEKEGLTLVVDGDELHADGTTLGGDDGIAVAMALAVLDAHDLPHPPIEAVFTVDEEIGLLGASAIDVSPLKGRRMINIDSEEEGIFTVSCAGGNRTTCTLPLARAAYEGTALRLTLGGLLGGHSGGEIHKGLGNSNMLMGRVLYALSQKTDLRLVTVAGGTKDNAIPLHTVAVLCAKDPAAVRAAVGELQTTLQNEYHKVDPGLYLHCEDEAASAQPMDKASTEKAICLLTCMPNGVQTMSADIAGLVQTSLNLGILTTEEGTLTASFSVRSSVESQKQMMVDRIRCLMAQLGGGISIHGDYPGWEYLANSPLRDLMVEVYRDQYGKDPKIEAIHAGLECGLFAGKLPGFDSVSIGPDMSGVHTSRERLSIPSTQRTWKMLCEVLRRAK